MLAVGSRIQRRSFLQKVETSTAAINFPTGRAGQCAAQLRSSYNKLVNESERYIPSILCRQGNSLIGPQFFKHRISGNGSSP